MHRKPTYEELEQRVGELEAAELERKRAEEALRESEHQLHLITDSSPAYIAYVGADDLRYYFVNRRFEEAFGRPRKDIIGQHIKEIIGESNYEFALKYIEQVRSGKSVSYENVFILEQGERWLKVNYVPDFDELGEVIGIVVLSYDITERKQTEKALRENEEFSSGLLENSPNPMLVLNRDTSVRYVNPMHEDLTGFTSAEVIGKKAPYPWWIDDPEFGTIDQRKKNIIEGVRRLERRYQKKNGELFWVEINRNPIFQNGELRYALTTWVDITERKRAEESLRSSEKRFRKLIEQSPIIYEMYDKDGVQRMVNPAYGELWEIDPSSTVGTFNVLNTEQGEKLHPYLDRAYSGETVVLPHIQWDPKKEIGEGRERWISTIIYPLQDSEGEVENIVILHEDITDRMKTEEALRESEERYRNLYDEAPVGYMEFDAEGRITNVNKKELEMLGYTYEEMVGQFIWNFILEKEDSRNMIKAKLSGDIPPVKGLERHYIRKDGTIFPGLIDDFLVKEKDGRIKGIRVINRDITDLKQAEEDKKRLESQLQQAMKMEAIGNLAGGIAHDLNNILSPIMIHSEMVMMDLLPENPLRFNLQQIYKAGERARDMVKQILAFSRQRQEARIPLRLGAILKEVIQLLRSSIPTTIEIRHIIKSEIDTVFADPIQIHQVILNLCSNASHAMREKGGVLEIEIDYLNLDTEDVSQFVDLKPGPYVLLRVSDTGDGIEPEIMEKIFEPYFTTKNIGEGTGMGLAAAHGIVKGNGGDIICESEPGKGTTFRVLFPKLEEDLSGDSENIVQLRGGTERILIVDDEKVVVDSIQPMLENLGYRVTARTSSIEALEVFRNRPDAFDLVITDMTMPNMTGKDLANALIALRPGIPIILCTGFSDQIDEAKAKGMGIRAFVMKPIVMREIANTMREVLEL